jgi:Spy/CpxP family protein refolding chaperone
MKNKWVVVILVLMFAVALGAGVVAGKLSTRVQVEPVQPARQGTLTDALNLTPKQRDQMQAIWENVRATANDCLEQAKRAQSDQDAALMKILTADQKAQYQKLNNETIGKIAVLDARRKESFKKAIDATNLILDESQRKRYAQIIKDRVGELPDGAWETPQ